MDILKIRIPEVSGLTEELIEEILESIGLEKISGNAKEEVWHVRQSEERGIQE